MFLQSRDHASTKTNKISKFLKSAIQFSDKNTILILACIILLFFTQFIFIQQINNHYKSLQPFSKIFEIEKQLFDLLDQTYKKIPFSISTQKNVHETNYTMFPIFKNFSIYNLINEVKNKFVEIDPFFTMSNKSEQKINISESLPQASSVIYKDKTTSASSHDHISRRPNPVMEEYKTETITISNDKKDHQKKRNKKKEDHSKNKEKRTTSKKFTNSKNKENAKKYSKESSDKIPKDKDTVIDDFNKLVNILEDEIRDIGEVFRNLTINSINYDSSFFLF